MGKPYKLCSCCGGNGYKMMRVKDENDETMMYKADCQPCNGFGILMRDPDRDSVKYGLAYRPMKGLFG